jgi:cell division septum initiation protein DivIVA
VDLSARIGQLEDMVRDAKSMPLSSSALLNRDEVLELIEQMKDALPDEIKQARWIVTDREELLAKARRDAESMVDQGRQEQLRLASHEAVVQKAGEESERILQEAADDARRLRLEAEDYVDAKLAQLENQLQRILEDLVGTNQGLSRTIDQVQAGREKLRGSVPTTNVDLGPDVQMPEMEGEEG